MHTEAGSEDLRPQVLLQALQQISTTVDRSTDCCIICLGDLTEQCEAQPCGHNNFDFICLITWLEQRATCPLCKTAVQEVRYELSDDKKQGKIYKVPEPSTGSTQGLRRSPSLSSTLTNNHSTLTRLPYREYIVQRRRLVYFHNLYSLHVGSNDRQPVGSSYREFSPQKFMTDPEFMHRARRWLTRELHVFQFLNISSAASHRAMPAHRARPSNSEYLLEYVIAILKNIDMQDSAGQAEELIQEFLGRKYTRLLLHELKSWLRSPFTSLDAWDSNVQYQDRAALPDLSQNGSTEMPEVSDIALKYHEPAEARKPPSSYTWRLYVFRGDIILETLELWQRSVWLLGREERVVDITTAHPSCSGQHAALQFRYVVRERDGDSRAKEMTQDVNQSGVGLFLIDLNSTHGTFLNGKRIDSNVYIEIKHKDMIVFGGSKREYVVIVPPVSTRQNSREV